MSTLGSDSSCFVRKSGHIRFGRRRVMIIPVAVANEEGRNLADQTVSDCKRSVTLQGLSKA